MLSLPYKLLLSAAAYALWFAPGSYLNPARLDSLSAPVTATAEIVSRGAGASGAASARLKDASNVAVWLIPRNQPSVTAGAAANPSSRSAELVQRNKTFEPHVLMVQAGTDVSFPNKDPFFHNIFSLFDGKRFDLGLYEAGSTRVVHLDRAGFSYLFCNIHPGMSAVVIVVDTPYFALSDSSGHLTIPAVPDGTYQLHIWYERSLKNDLEQLEREVAVSPSSRSLGTLRVAENPSFTPAHKNKYGEEYVPPPTPGYVAR